MKITLELPAELLDELLMLTGATSKTQVVKDAIEEHIKLIKRKRLVTMKGTIDLENLL